MGKYYCDGCNMEIDNVIFDDEEVTFICAECGAFVEYIFNH